MEPPILEDLSYQPDTATSEERSFDDQHEHLISRYGKELPPVDSKISIITVIPAFRELENNNLWRFLRSFGLQKNESLEKVEAIWAINNTEHDVTTEAGTENQQTLSILSLIQQSIGVISHGADLEETSLDCIEKLKQAGIALTEWEEDIVKLCIRKKVKVYGIDMSSESKAISKREVPRGETVSNLRGFAKHVSSHIAFERLNRADIKTQKGLIDYLDADCFLPPNYYEELLRTQNTDSIWFAKGLIGRSPDISSLVYKPHDDCARFLGLANQLRSSIQETFWYLRARPGHAGPTPVVRAAAIRSVGGYPYYEIRSTDHAFGQNMDHFAGDPSIIGDTFVNLCIRHHYNSIDGASIGSTYHLDKRYQGLELLEEFQNVEKKKEKHIDLIDALEQNKILSTSPKAHEYIERRRELFRRESLQRQMFVDHSEKLLSVLVKHPRDGYIDKDYLMELKQEGYITSREEDFFSENPAFIDALETLQRISMDSQTSTLIPHTGDQFGDIMSMLRTFIPEYFELPPQNEPDYADALERLSNGEHLNERDYVHVPFALFPYRERNTY